MPLIAEAPNWAFMAYCAILTLAAIQDSIWMKISNYFVLALLVLALATMVVVGLDISLWQNFAGFVILLVLGTIVFSKGIFGGGDVKLLAVTALFFAFSGLFKMLVAVAIAGGILTVLVVGARAMFGDKDGKAGVAIVRKGGMISYGIAIAIGAILVAARSRGLV